MMNFSSFRNLAVLEWAALSVFVVVLFQNCTSTGGPQEQVSQIGDQEVYDCPSCQNRDSDQAQIADLYRSGDVVLHHQGHQF